MKSAQYWIDQLKLTKHPEGGYFREVYQSTENIPLRGLPSRYSDVRAFATHIYFLITYEGFSAFHRLQTDEIWHFYTGSPCKIHMIAQDGSYSSQKLGQNPEAGEHFQAVVAAGYWFAVNVKTPGEFALMGCTMAPGFDFDDFVLAERKELVSAFPRHTALIESLTR